MGKIIWSLGVAVCRQREEQAVDVLFSSCLNSNEVVVVLNDE